MNKLLKNDKSLQSSDQDANKENRPVHYNHYFNSNMKSEALFFSKGITADKNASNVNSNKLFINSQNDFKDEKPGRSHNIMKTNENLLGKTAPLNSGRHFGNEINKSQSSLNNTDEVKLCESKRIEKNTNKLISEPSKFYSFKSVKHKTENHCFVTNSLITPKQKSLVLNTLSGVKPKRQNTFEGNISTSIKSGYVHAQQTSKSQEYKISTNNSDIIKNESQEQNSNQLKLCNNFPQSEDNKTSENVPSLVERLKQGASFLNNFPMLVEPGTENLDEEEDNDYDDDENSEYYKNCLTEDEFEDEKNESLQILKIRNGTDKKIMQDEVNATSIGQNCREIIYERNCSNKIQNVHENFEISPNSKDKIKSINIIKPKGHIEKFNKYLNFPLESKNENGIPNNSKNSSLIQNTDCREISNSDRKSKEIKSVTSVHLKSPCKKFQNNGFSSQNKSKEISQSSDGSKIPSNVKLSDEVCCNPTNKQKNEIMEEQYLKMCQQISANPEKKKFKTLKINQKTYFKLNLLGKGGSSKVYQVYDYETGNILAVKKVKLTNADFSIKEGYKNEIKLLQQLQKCDRVVKLYDFEYCSNDSEILVVMEKGDTDLATALKNAASSEPLTPVTIKFYWSEMLKAVKEIHDAGIIHSDLKPANFLLVSGKLKLIDFGISSSVQKDMTSVIKDSQIGTVNFMPPEAIQSIYHPSEHRNITEKRFKINKRADVWSLGCILYNLVYGQTPFQCFHNIIAKFQAIINPNYEIKFLPLDDEALLNVLQSCLIRDPYKRPSIEDLLQHPYLRSNHEDTKETPSTLRMHSAINQLLQHLTPKCRGRVQEVAEKLNLFS